MSATAPSNSPPVILPATGKARVKSVLSGDTVVLLGSARGNAPPPEVIFTFEGVQAPRLVSKSNPVDEPGAFQAREWLRKLVIGKFVKFETKKQGASAGDRVYGWLFLDDTHLAIAAMQNGHGTPKSIQFNKELPEDDPDSYEHQLVAAYKQAEAAQVGIHAPQPLVRAVKNAGNDFEVLGLVQAAQKRAPRLRCVIEYIFDGGRFRCHVTDTQLPDFQYANFTLFLAGVGCPRFGNPNVDPPIPMDYLAPEARQFVTARLLQRELEISLVGTDKNGQLAVGIVHHPVGNIGVELLKVGLARMTDWSVRLLPPAEVPALRIAEHAAKRTHQGIWKDYAPPVLSVSQLRGTVIEVQSGDTILVLPDGQLYDSDAKLKKISLASIRAPRMGSQLSGRATEPYAAECKDKLRQLLVGKSVTIEMHYERDIPLRPGETEKRPFGTVAVGKYPDVSEILLRDGLATTQMHRDDDEKSPRYDELRNVEAQAKTQKKGLHGGDYKAPTVNDLTDQRKAKAYSGSLTRAGTLKAVVEYVFNGALFKLFVPAENCTIRFANNYVRCPQPTRPQGPGEPFGDAGKFHARQHLLQRQVEIVCQGVSNGGIIFGNLNVGYGNQRRDYTMELLGAGLARLDQRKVDYDEVPRTLVEAQNVAKANKVGLWSLAQEPAVVVPKTAEKVRDTVVQASLTEIRSGNHFFYQVQNDESRAVIDESMRVFTQTHGTAGGPCDSKVGKTVAALFDDGSGKTWYRAKVVERKGPSKVAVLFVDYGNVATVPIATHLRPLDTTLGTDRIPAIAKEAVLALTKTRDISTDEGLEAARMLQSLCWGKSLTIRAFAKNESNIPTVQVSVDELVVNVKLIQEGLARATKDYDYVAASLVDPAALSSLATEVKAAEGQARRSRNGMWRYGDVGDEDPDEI